MTRFLLGVAALTAAVSFHPEPARAQSGIAPWCAVVSIGAGTVQWDCHYRSIEECRPNVIAGNRGFCNMNPAWEGWNRSEPKPRKRHRRHVAD